MSSSPRRPSLKSLTYYVYVPPEDDELRPCPDPEIEKLLAAAQQAGYVGQFVAKHSGVWWECSPGKKSRRLRKAIVRRLPKTWKQRNDND